MKKIFIILCIFWIGFIAYNTSQTGESSNNTSVFITEGIIKNDDYFIKKLNKYIRKLYTLYFLY